MIDLSLKSLSAKANLCSESLCKDMLKNFVCNDLDWGDNDISSYLRKIGNKRWKESECDSLRNAFSIKDLLDREKCEKIFHYFFIQDGLQIHVRDERLAEYADVGRYCHPYIFIAAYLALRLETGTSHEEWCAAVSNNILESALSHRHRVSFAENHCHFSGARNSNVMLVTCLDQNNVKGYKKEKDKNTQQKDANEKIFINSKKNDTDSDLFHLMIFISSFAFLNECLNCQSKDHPVQEFKDILGSLLWRFRLDLPDYFHCDFCFKRIPLLDFSQLCCLRRNELLGNNYPRLLRYALIQYEKNHFDSVLLLYLTCFFQFVWNKGKENAGIKMSFLLFVQELNILRSKIIMSEGAGLADFVRFFDDRLRDVGKTVNNAARSIFMSGTSHSELRLGKLPNKALLKDSIYPEVRRTLENYYPSLCCSVKKEFMVCSQDKILFDFGYHFIKAKEKDESGKSSESYYRKANNNRKIQKDILHFFEQEKQNINITDSEDFISHSSEKKLYFDLRLSLRTLDAAGDENLFPPEVFAPAARAIRNNLFFRESSLNCGFINPTLRQFRRIRFAFHAGEDFTHIVTGMRRVYETIDFFEYEHDDRLGHALAIGLNPLKWVEKHNEVIIPFEEFFDNCVWLYEMAVQIGRRKKDFFAWALFYERKIHELQKKISPQPKQNSPQDLFVAYQERKYLWKNGANEHDMTNPLDGNPSKEIAALVNAYKNRHIDLGKLFEKTAFDDPWKKKILIVFDDQSSSDGGSLFFEREYVRKDEIDFWEAVQDYLLQMCADKGIILEANPSSNVAISEIKRYCDHPVFRWSPLSDDDIAPNGKYNRFGLRSGRVRVCVNSDDPGIFNTTLQNEFHLLEETAKSQASAERVKGWIDYLRKEGVDIFLDNYISPFSVLS